MPRHRALSPARTPRGEKNAKKTEPPALPGKKGIAKDAGSIQAAESKAAASGQSGSLLTPQEAAFVSFFHHSDAYKEYLREKLEAKKMAEAAAKAEEEESDEKVLDAATILSQVEKNQAESVRVCTWAGDKSSNSKSITWSIDDVRRLFSLLSTDTTVQTLEFARTLKEPEAQLLANSLAQNNKINLTSLSIRGANMTDEDLAPLIPALCSPHIKLQFLRLRNNRLAGASATALARVLDPYCCPTSQIHTLKLSNNKLRDDGARAIFNGLIHNTVLHTLLLDFNEITDKGLAPLSNVLAVNKTLTILDLKSNDVVAFPLDVALKTDCKLKQLILAGNRNLMFPPQHISSSSSASAVIDYFADIRKGASRLDSVKVLIVGNGGVGKTTLKQKALLQLAPVNSDISKWTVDDVQRWSRVRSFPLSIQKVFANHQISGSSLVMDPEHLKRKFFALLPSDFASTFYDEVQLLLAESARAQQGHESMYLSSIGIEWDTLTIPLKDSAAFEPLLSPRGPSAPPPSATVAATLTSPRGRGAGSPPEALQLQILDFAGQSEYFVTHKLFLTDVNAVYVVVAPLVKKQIPPDFKAPATSAAEPAAAPCDPSSTSPSASFSENTEFRSQWGWWLSFLKSLFPPTAAAPTILALTQIDRAKALDSNIMVPSADALRDELGDLFRPSLNVSTCVPIDYEDGGMSGKAIRSAIFNAARKLATSTLIPKSYLFAKNRVEFLVQRLKKENKLPIMALSKLKEGITQAHAMFKSETEEEKGLAAALSNNPALVDRALEFLQGAGSILIDERIDKVVLDPLSWFSSVLAAFVSENRPIPLIPVRLGLCLTEDILTHKDALNCDQDTDIGVVMRLLEKVELCFPVHQSDKSHPSSEWSQWSDFVAENERMNADTQAPIINSNPATPSANPNSKLPFGYVFPCLLPDVDPISHHQKWFGHTPRTNNVNERLVYVGRSIVTSQTESYFPPALFPSLQYRLHRLFPNQCDLRKGFIMVRTVSVGRPIQAMVVMNPAQRAIDIICRGFNAHPYTLLGRIFHVIISLLSKYAGVSYGCKALCQQCMQQIELEPHGWALSPPAPNVLLDSLNQLTQLQNMGASWDESTDVAILELFSTLEGSQPPPSPRYVAEEDIESPKPAAPTRPLVCTRGHEVPSLKVVLQGFDELHQIASIAAVEPIVQDQLTDIRYFSEGFFGYVLRAIYRGQEVVIKVPKHAVPGEQWEETRKYLLLSSHGHPNVVGLLGVCPEFTARHPRNPDIQISGKCCVVMPFASGGCLESFIAKHYQLVTLPNGRIHQVTSLPPITVVHMALHIASGLAFLHKNEFVHRDLRSANLLTFFDDASSFRLCLTDFGLSRDVYKLGSSKKPLIAAEVEAASEVEKPSPASSPNAPSNDNQPQRDVAVIANRRAQLPVPWLPPESIRRAQHSTRSDVWMFAMTMYEILSGGKRPFIGLSCAKDGAGGSELPESICPDGLRSILLRCTAHNELERPTAVELMQLLHAYRQTLPFISSESAVGVVRPFAASSSTSNSAYQPGATDSDPPYSKAHEAASTSTDVSVPTTVPPYSTASDISSSCISSPTHLEAIPSKDPVPNSQLYSFTPISLPEMQLEASAESAASQADAATPLPRTESAINSSAMDSHTYDAFV